MSHKILYSQKQNKEDSGMNIIDIKGLRELLNASPDKTIEDNPDLIKELKQRISFDFTTKTKDTPPAPVEDTLIAAFRDASTKASFGLLDGFVQLNQRWHNGGHN